MENYCYNKIAEDYHHKRKKPWKPLENFLRQLEIEGFLIKGICVDLGCANGRNFKLLKNENNILIGIDISLELLTIARYDMINSSKYSKKDSKKIHIILGDVKKIPIRSNLINNLFSIATMHHIKDKSERKKALSGIYQIIKANGFIIITVWRKWLKKSKFFFLSDWVKRFFNPIYRKQQKKKGLNEFGDKYVPWTVSSEEKTYNRFYHFFSRHEIKKLINKDFRLKKCIKLGGPTKKDNFFILAQK